MALRAFGRLSSRMRIWPELGAGSSVTRIKGPASASVEYLARRTVNRPNRRAIDGLTVKANLGAILKNGN
jgi:hypothetical protein